LKLSIIIVNYRAWSFLDDCLDGLLSDPDSYEWQIIVVDNHSDDGQIGHFKQNYPDIEFIENELNAGFAFGCNTGARLATTQRLLFLNPDVSVSPGQIGALMVVKDLHGDITILTASQVNGKGQAQKTWDIFPNLFTYFKSIKSLLRKAMPGRYPNPRDVQTGMVYCDWVSGAVLLIEREHFEELGAWSEDYWLYSEDCDLCYQAQRQDLLVACTPEVTFLHHHGGASRQNKEITALAKTEAIISKHVFNHRNRRGLLRFSNHALIILANVPELCFWTLLDLLTLHRLKALSIRRTMLGLLFSHYARVLRTRDWRSPRIASLS